MPTYDPNNPNQDPRQQMSSGGPGNYQPPASAPPLFDPSAKPGQGADPFNGPNSLGTGLQNGTIAPGDRSSFVGGIMGQFGLNPLGNVDEGRNLPPNMQDVLNLGGWRPQSTGSGLAPVGGAPQVPTWLGPPGSSGVGGDVGTLQGLDMTQPGALEAYQKQTAGYFGQPTLSEMFAKQALAQGAGPGVSNRAEQAFQQFNSSAPANMDAYYDNERRKGEENIRRQMAARGSYGSSATDDLYNEMDTNLAADAAKANAQYGLQRGTLLGSLAQGADQSSLAGSGDRRNWMGALGNIAGAGDRSGLERVIAGGNLAGGAQTAQRTRGQDAFNNQLQMGDRMSGIMGQDYGNMFGTDADLFKTIVGLNTGTASEGYSQASQNALQQRQNVSNFNNLLGGNMQMGQGLYDMFNKPSTPAPSPMPASPQGYVGPSSYDNYGTTNWYQP